MILIKAPQKPCLSWTELKNRQNSNNQERKTREEHFPSLWDIEEYKKFERLNFNNKITEKHVQYVNRRSEVHFPHKYFLSNQSFYPIYSSPLDIESHIDVQFDQYFQSLTNNDDEIRAHEWVNEFTDDKEKEAINEAAGQLVKAIEENLPALSDKTSRKLENSQFLHLMRNVRDNKAVLNKENN